MSSQPTTDDQEGDRLLALYDAALPIVYGYLVARSSSTQLGEELTSETFLAAAEAVRRHEHPELSTAWLLGVARHKLVDHWRRREREESKLRLVGELGVDDPDSWNVRLDALRARTVLDRLPAQYRAVLTLRYLDDLPVSEVAGLLDRSVHATEALLVRAKSAFRRLYGSEDDDA